MPIVDCELMIGDCGIKILIFTKNNLRKVTF